MGAHLERVPFTRNGSRFSDAPISKPLVDPAQLKIAQAEASRSGNRHGFPRRQMPVSAVPTCRSAAQVDAGVADQHVDTPKAATAAAIPASTRLVGDVHANADSAVRIAEFGRSSSNPPD